MSCPHCDKDLTSPEAVELGKRVPGLRPSRAATQLQVRAPQGSLERILEKLEEAEKVSGQAILDIVVTLRTQGGRWTETRFPTVEIIGRKRA